MRGRPARNLCRSSDVCGDLPSTRGRASSGRASSGARRVWRPSIDERPRFVRPRFVRPRFVRRVGAAEAQPTRGRAWKSRRARCRRELATGGGVLRRRIAAATDPPLALLGPSDAALEMVRACLLKLRLASRGSRSPVTRVSATGSPDGSSLSLLRSPPCGGGEARMWHALIRTACPCAQTHACTSCH